MIETDWMRRDLLNLSTTMDTLSTMKFSVPESGRGGDNDLTGKPRLSVANTFECEATEVLTGLKDAFKGVIATLGVRRPVELQRLLKLQTTLSWQIFKLANERNVLSAGGAVPSRASVIRFADAASAGGVSAERVRDVLQAYDNFDALVQRHAGDRTSFNSLVAAATGFNDEWLAADLQHRRNIFRGMSHLLGVQARTRLTCFILAKSAQGPGFEAAAIQAYMGLRMLRPREAFRVFRFGMTVEKPGDNLYDSGPIREGSVLDGYCLNEFCSEPLPHMTLKKIEQAQIRWVEASLVRPEVGKLGVSDLVFGARHHSMQSDAFATTVGAPTEVLLLDVLVQKGIVDNVNPRLEVFIGGENDFNPDYTRLEGKFEVEPLGTGAAALATADVPHYSEMVQAATDSFGQKIEEFEAWRVRLEFPVFRSVARLWLKQPETRK